MSGKKLHIAVDMDDVMAEFSAFILTCWEREYGIHIPHESITSFNCLLDGSLGPEWEWLQKRDWLWAKVPAMPGAIGGVAKLRAAGHYLEAVTSKPDWAEWTVWAWLGKWRPEFNRVTIVPLGRPKTEATGAELLIDDAIHNVEPWIASGRDAILFSRPWNRNHCPARGVWGNRARNWADVLGILKVTA